MVGWGGVGTGAHRITGFPKAFPEVEPQAIARRDEVVPWSGLGTAENFRQTVFGQRCAGELPGAFRGVAGSCLCKTTGKVVRQAKLSQSPFLVFGVQSAEKTCLFTSPG